LIIDSREAAHAFVSSLSIPQIFWSGDSNENDFAEYIFAECHGFSAAGIDAQLEMRGYLDSLSGFFPDFTSDWVWF